MNAIIAVLFVIFLFKYGFKLLFGLIDFSFSLIFGIIGIIAVLCLLPFLGILFFGRGIILLLLLLVLIRKT